MVRPDTRGQFQQHVGTQYTVGRLLVFDVSTPILPFFIGSDAPTAHDVSTIGMASEKSETLLIFRSEDVSRFGAAILLI